MEQIQFIFHIFLVAKENEIMVTIDEWIRQGKGQDGQHFTPEICRHRVLFMEMMSEIPKISGNREEAKRYLCKTRKEMQLSSGRSSPDTSCTLVQVRKRLGTLKKYADVNQKENGMNWESISCAEASNLGRMHQFPERRIEARW